jgi:urea carboxylase-associated protein 2
VTPGSRSTAARPVPGAGHLPGLQPTRRWCAACYPVPIMSQPRFEPSLVLWEETVPGGAHWSGVLRRGTTLRVTDPAGGANAAVLLLNAEQPLERYNMADTLKAQHTFRLTAGHVLYSDMGRILCSIAEDTTGWIDPVGGVSDAALVDAKYGVARYQQHRNAYHRNGRDGLVNELAKYGLGPRHLVEPVNLFSKVTADAAGALTFHPGHARAGAHVDLRCEMNVLVALTTCQHPLDPAPAYGPRDVRLTAWRSGPAGPDDPCRRSRPENGRGFENTERLFR